MYIGPAIGLSRVWVVLALRVCVCVLCVCCVVFVCVLCVCVCVCVLCVWGGLFGLFLTNRKVS